MAHIVQKKSMSLNAYAKKYSLYISVLAFIAVIGVTFAVVNSKSNLDSRSKAAVGTSTNIVFVNQNNTPIAQTDSPFINVRLTSPWQAETQTASIDGIVAGESDVLANVSSTFQVKNGIDDVNENDNEYITNQRTLFVGNAESRNNSWSGFRFTNVNIPKGAKINSAQLVVHNPSQQWIAMSFTISGDKSTNSPAFSSSSKPSRRTLTTAKVNHNSNARWLANNWYALDNMSTVVQEIVNQSNWQSGNSMSIILKGTGSQFGRKNITSFEGNKSNAPRLVISYSTPETQPTSTKAPTATKTPPTPTRVQATNTKVPPTATRTQPTATKVPVSPSPVPYTISVELAEDSGFTKNYVKHPYVTHPMNVTYTFSDSNIGQKTVYARFTSSTGQTQVHSNWIDLVATPSNTPIPTTPPTGGHTGHGDNSHAMGLWNPNPKYDTCPNPADTVRIKEIHDSYKVQGPDGKWYPTWHPPVDPATGCKFGHEHGRDPKESNLLQFLKETYGYDADGNGRVEGSELDTAGIPFGYVNEQLDIYNTAKGINDGMRHEDHVGHKIEWENNLMRQWSTNTGGVPRGPDSGVRCNFFMKVHQGTHSKDAFTNNMHELIQGYDCTDGIKMANAQMILFGRAGGFTAGRKEGGGGSYFQAVGNPTPLNSPSSGANVLGRAIPDINTVREYIVVPQGSWSLFSNGLYEDWISGNYVELPNGTDLAYYDPHFAVFSPSRFFWPGNDTNTMGITRTEQDKADNIGRSVDTCFMTENNGAERARGGECDLMTNYGQIKSMAWDDPRSTLNGVKREFYFNNMAVYNTNGNTVWYADPFGKNASTTPFTGSVKHYLKPKNTPGEYQYPFESNAIGGDRYYGGNGVHAPN